MSDIKKELLKCVSNLYRKDILDSAGGNCSVKDGERILITRRRSSSERNWNLDDDYIIETDLAGKAKKPELQDFLSREAAVHYRILNEFPDINAVIHAHPKYLLGFASLKVDMPIVTGLARDWLFPQYVKCIRNEPEVSVREAIAITKYFRYLYNLNPNCGLACLLHGHGAVVAGRDITEAFSKMEALENNARTFYYMQVIKSSEYYREARQKDLEDMYGDWEHIQRSQIKEVELYFEKENS